MSRIIVTSSFGDSFEIKIENFKQLSPNELLKKLINEGYITAKNCSILYCSVNTNSDQIPTEKYNCSLEQLGYNESKTFVVVIRLEDKEIVYYFSSIEQIAEDSTLAILHNKAFSLRNQLKLNEYNQEKIIEQIHSLEIEKEKTETQCKLNIEKITLIKGSIQDIKSELYTDTVDWSQIKLKIDNLIHSAHSISDCVSPPDPVLFTFHFDEGINTMNSSCLYGPGIFSGFNSYRKHVISSYLDIVSEKIENEESAVFSKIRNHLDYLNDIHNTQKKYIEQLRQEKQFLEEEINALFQHTNYLQNINKVFSSVFCPEEIGYKSHMLVQVYLHLWEETDLVQSLARESQKETKRRGFIPLQCHLKHGDKVDILLNINGESLLHTEKKSIIWQGSFTKCSFSYFVPGDIKVKELNCKTVLTANEIPIGEMRFITKIVRKPRYQVAEVINRNYRKVFISYAHLDEDRVSFLARGLKVAGIDHFFDREYLKAGDIYPEKIRDYINSADLFILCWSKNAAASDYVTKERTQALSLAYPQKKENATLSMYPIRCSPHAELPDDMKGNYHFETISNNLPPS